MELEPVKAWKTRSRRTILEYSQFLTVEEHAVELPDGRAITGWPWIITPDFVNIVVETEDRRFLCFRQQKYGVDGLSLAPVGGFLEPDEDPLSGAQRELLEETGYEAAEWIPLGIFRVDPNRGAGTAHFYLARGAQPVTEPDPDDLEEQEWVFLEQAELAAALSRGEFKALPWASIVALALQRMEG
jgi:ADP-ribose pyrophosphatase